MGDIADDIIGDILDPETYFEEEREDYGVKCKYCRRGSFVWKKDFFGDWRLYTEKGHLHRCRGGMEN